MLLDLNKIGAEGVRFDHRLGLSVLEVEGADRVTVRQTRLSGAADPGERGLEFKGHLEATVGLCCSRCVESFERPIRADFLLTIVPDAAEFGVGETRLPEEDVNLFYAKDGKVDLGEIAREQIYLHLPLKPVCDPACKGLCPTCGGNRNRIECACTREEVDPRLQPLLEFKKRLSGDS
jgi:uncharacterized protein